MPSMVSTRQEHSSVAVKTKLLVIGGWKNGSCEVFESISAKFFLLKSPISFGSNAALSLSIGNKNFIFYNDESYSYVVSYDVDEDKWS